MSRPRLIALLLALAALAVYLPVVGHGFIIYDDGDYVTGNDMVQGGLSRAGIKWAFTTFHSANWHPLTWLSHMLDCELFGLNAAGSHFINALFHAANTVLLFALWLQLTSRLKDSKTGAPANESETLWPAAFMAALFALHPLHVESVAWVAERKDVLSAFFGLLALLCYASHANSGRRLSFSYWLALFFFACALMSKPMLVTLPFVMLLLDYWPLQRLSRATLKQVLVEKIPFFLLTAASCVVTYLAQSRGAVKSLADVPLVYRLENAPVALVTYLLKMIWPARLAVIYPMPHSIPPVTFIACSVILIFITVAALVGRKKYPFLPVGWFWFVGMMVPVLGLVKVGDAAMADRYTYLPSIGIFMLVAFGAEQFRRSLPKFALPIAAVFILGALIVVTERQLSFWRDDETLFKHAMEVTTDNMDAVINYGVALENEGKPHKALAQYQRAETMGRSYMAHVNSGNLLLYMGDTNGALAEYRQAVQVAPTLSTLHDRLGSVLAEAGHFAEATNEFYEAMRQNGTSSFGSRWDWSPHLHLGMALAAHNDFAGATNEFSEAMQMAPNNPQPLVEWAKAFLQQGRDAEAIEELHRALQLAPDDFQTLTFTARALAANEDAESRNGTNAVAFAEKADTLTGSVQPLVKDVLGMAYAEAGRFDDAQKAANDAIQLATAAEVKSETIAAMQDRLELYQRHQPWRESFLLRKK